MFTAACYFISSVGGFTGF